MKTYILDTNIVIKIWKDKPYLFDLLDKYPNVNYKIPNDSICELTRGCGELEQFFPKVSDKYKKILEHIINNPSSILNSTDKKENVFIKKDNDELSLIKGNVISSVDYSIMVLCQNNPNFILVTDDKNMLKSSVLILQDSQIMNYDNFIKDLTKTGLKIP